MMITLFILTYFEVFGFIENNKSEYFEKNFFLVVKKIIHWTLMATLGEGNLFYF